MDHKYYRDLKNNYLVMENTDSGDSLKNTSDYRLKIVESGNIKGLLPCTERNINGERFYYYEIGSMQTLKDRFFSGGMTCEDIKNLLTSIKDLMSELSEYLLGEEGMVFNIDEIYTDLSTGEYRFMYCPFYPEEKSFADMAVQLLDLPAAGDSAACDLVYKLCDSAAISGIFVSDAIDAVLGENAPDQKETELDKKVYVPADQPVSGCEESFDEEVDYDDEDFEPSQGRIRLSGKKLGGRMELIISLMFMLLVGAMFYIRMNFILSSEENILSVIVMIVSVVTGAVSLVSGIRDFKKEPLMHREPKEEKEPELYNTEDTFEEFMFEQETVKKPVPVTSYAAKDIPGSAETVLLDAEEKSGMTLYSTNIDGTQRIELVNLPITIGKMEGCVDRVVGDTSISRIHCRIFDEDGKIALMDLGSTNGTFRNGKKLAPKRSIFLERGDEIRLGRVCFDCR